MKTTNNDEKIKPLVEMIKKGDFFGMQAWINAGKPIFNPKSLCHSTIQYAASYGFLSALQILLAEGWKKFKEPLNLALRAAVKGNNCEMCKLLLDEGAAPDFVHWDDILSTYNGEIFKLFLEHNKSMLQKYDKLGYNLSWANKSILGVVKNYYGKVEGMEPHVLFALHNAIKENNLKQTSLLLWAGADARKSFEFEGEDYSPAIENAIHYGNLKIIKMMFPGAEDNLTLYFSKCYEYNEETIDYFFKKGVALNDKANGGSTLLEDAFQTWRFSQSNIKMLIQKGARLVVEDDKYWFRCAREKLSKLFKNDIIKLLQMLKPAADEKTMSKLLDSSKLKAILKMKKSKLMKKIGYGSASTEEAILGNGQANEVIAEGEVDMQSKDSDFPVTKEEGIGETNSHIIKSEGLRADNVQPPEPGSNEPDDTNEKTAENSNGKLTRKILYEAVWEKPVTEVAKQYGLSDVAIAKKCRRYKIPHPPRGYWAKLKAGIRVKSEKLPNPKYDPIINMQSDGYKYQGNRKKHADDKKQIPQIIVPENIPKYHPLVSKTRKALTEKDVDEYGHFYYNTKGCLPIKVSNSSLPRTLKIFDTILREIEKRGWVYELNSYGYYGVVFWGETVAFGLKEKFLHGEPYSSREIPTGLLTLYCNRYWSRRSNWNDGKRQKIEMLLDDFFITLEDGREEIKKRHFDRKHEKRLQRLRDLKIAKFKGIKNSEKDIHDEIMEDMRKWKKAKSIRDYVSAFRTSRLKQKGKLYRREKSYIKYGMKLADRLDPLVATPPSILDIDISSHEFNKPWKEINSIIKHKIRLLRDN